MASVTIVMSGDDARLRAAHERWLRDQEKALENYNRAFNKGKEAQAQAEKDLAGRKAAAQAEKERLATIEKGQRLIEGQMTAQEQFNAKMAEAEALYKAGAIAESDLARRKEILTKKLQEESGAEKERQAVMDKGRKLIESQRTAQEKYNASLAEAEELHTKGAIGADDLAKRIAFLNKQLHEESGEAARAKDAEAKRLEVIKQGEAVTRRHQTGIERYRETLKELNRLHKEGAISIETFNRAQQSAADEFSASEGAIGGVLGKVTGIASAYISIQSGVAIYNDLLREQNELQQSALDKTMKMASAQSDAIKNLTGLNFMQTSELLNKNVEEIAIGTGFANRAEITQAIGAGVSSGGTPEEVLSAVEASAAINKQTPERMGATAIGAIDLARATGIKDAEQNIGFISDVSAVSTVKELDRLSSALGKTLGSVASTMGGIDKETAARQGGALFAVLNTLANDKFGDTTATAEIQFSAYLEKFFDNAGLKDVSDQIARLESRKEITAEEALRIREAEKKLSEASTPLEKEKAEVTLNAVRARATLNALDEQKLEKLRDQQEQFANIKDPGDIRGRLLAIQNADEETRRRFIEGMPGEATFKKPLELLATKGSQAFATFESNLEQVDFNPDTYDKLRQQVTSATPQLSVADAVATAEAYATAPQPGLDRLAAIKKLRNETLPQVRPEGILVPLQQKLEEYILSFYQETDVRAAGDLTKRLFEGSRRDLKGDSSPGALERIEKIDRALRSLDVLVNASESIARASENISNAGEKMNSAAATNLEAAKIRERPQPVSIAPAARDQAATANR